MLAHRKNSRIVRGYTCLLRLIIVRGYTCLLRLIIVRRYTCLLGLIIVRGYTCLLRLIIVRGYTCLLRLIIVRGYTCLLRLIIVREYTCLLRLIILIMCQLVFDLTTYYCVLRGVTANTKYISLWFNPQSSNPYSTSLNASTIPITSPMRFGKAWISTCCQILDISNWCMGKLFGFLPDEDFSRNALFALNFISSVLFRNCAYPMNVSQETRCGQTLS